MTFNEEFWENYAKENESQNNVEFCKFISDLARSLHCKSILEAGCSTGSDLNGFSDDFQVSGIDLSDYALEMAKEKHPDFVFKKASITELPFENTSIDFVFTHKVLNYLDDEQLDKAISEMFRVTSRYVVNCEIFSEDESKDETSFRARNILNRWMDYKVKVVSNVDMHEEIEPQKARFTLVRKL